MSLRRQYGGRLAELGQTRISDLRILDSAASAELGTKTTPSGAFTVLSEEFGGLYSPQA
jgi:hypothetical protein